MTLRPKYKAALLIYEWVSSRTGSKCYCLSDRTVAMLLTLTGTLYWRTRWEGYKDFTETQLQEVFEWSSEVERELMNGCCDGSGQTVRTRVNADGRVEVSTDDGLTWEQDDSYDPRSTNTVYEPIRTDGTPDENACAAANAFDENLQETKANIIAALGTYTNAAGVAAALTPFVATYVGIPVVGATVALTVFTIGLAGIALNQTAVVIEDAFDDPYFAFMKCQYQCVIGEGEATWADLDTIQNALFEEYGLATPEDACKVLLTIAIFKTAGPVGITNMGRVGTGAGECEPCACDFTDCFDFTISQQEWIVAPPYGATVVYDAGQGWGRTEGGLIAIRLEMPESNISEFRFSLDTPMTGNLQALFYAINGSVFDNTNTTQVAMGNEDGWIVGGIAVPVTSIEILTQSNSPDDQNPLDYHITYATITGTGDNPFPDYECEPGEE